MTLLTGILQQHHWFTLARIIWITFMVAIFVFGIKMPRMMKAFSKSIEDAKAQRDGRSHEREEYP